MILQIKESKNLNSSIIFKKLNLKLLPSIALTLNRIANIDREF